MHRRLAVGLTIVSLLLGSAFAASAEELPPGGSFIDDDGSTFEGNIEAIAAAGITRGCNPPANDRFCPSDNVTRGQMAAFLGRALGLAPNSADLFIDDNSSIFEADIQALAAAGITRGCNPPANNRFCPTDNVTRGQMAAFLSRALDLPNSSTDLFDDDNSSIFEADIQALAAAGITRGCNPPANNRFCPTDNVTRGQMAAFIARALDLPRVGLPTRMSLIDDFAVSCQTFVSGFQDCVGQGTWPAGQRFYIRHGWVLEPGSSSLEEGQFRSSGTEFVLFVNGTRQPLTTAGAFELGDELVRDWTRDFPNGQTVGTTRFTGQWRWNGVTELQIDINVTFEARSSGGSSDGSFNIGIPLPAPGIPLPG